MIRVLKIGVLPILLLGAAGGEALAADLRPEAKALFSATVDEKALQSAAGRTSAIEAAKNYATPWLRSILGIRPLKRRG